MFFLCIIYAHFMDVVCFSCVKRMYKLQFIMRVTCV
jgi:hypothetical protein